MTWSSAWIAPIARPTCTYRHPLRPVPQPHPGHRPRSPLGMAPGPAPGTSPGPPRALPGTARRPPHRLPGALRRRKARTGRGCRAGGRASSAQALPGPAARRNCPDAVGAGPGGRRNAGALQRVRELSPNSEVGEHTPLACLVRRPAGQFVAACPAAGVAGSKQSATS
jgi:hypothetical protein